MQSAFLKEPIENKPKEKIINEYEQIEMQMARLQDNIKNIAKHFHIVAVDQTKAGDYVIIYAADDGNVFRFMAHSCQSAFTGRWDFSIHASYAENKIHIDDMRGPADQGFGSVCMKHLKEYAAHQNKEEITGKLAERDWDHVDRLIHFYRKHQFTVELDNEKQSGFIQWQNK